MRGHVYRTPSNRYRAQVELGRKSDGSRRRMSATFDTEEAARLWVVETTSKLGADPGYMSGVTLAQYWERYTVTKGERLTRATFEGYERSMRRAWLPALGHFDISTIERSHIQAVLLALPSGSIARERKKALSAVLGQAVTDGVLTDNPAAGGRFEYPEDVGAARTFDEGDDPFSAIESSRSVWSPAVAIEAMGRLVGTSFEGAWLVMVGGGLRLEEALALTWRDVRRSELPGRLVVQVAVTKAYTRRDGLKRAKTPRSVRIVSILEPFASRLWSLKGEPDELVCSVSASNLSRRWRKMWEEMSDSKHVPKMGADAFLRGRMVGLPFVPLSRMRATHATFLQEAGVADSLNAAVHGHSKRVAYGHYLRPDGSEVLEMVEPRLKLVGDSPQFAGGRGGWSGRDQALLGENRATDSA